MRLLRQLASEHGTAILVVTHDTRMINEVDRVIHLLDGKIQDADTLGGDLPLELGEGQEYIQS